MIRVYLIFTCLGSIFYLSQAFAEDSLLSKSIHAKAGSYRVSGNLFEERQVGGKGASFKMKNSSNQETSKMSGPWYDQHFSWMLVFDIDQLSGSAHERVHFPPIAEEKISLTWLAIIAYGCADKSIYWHFCLGLPLSKFMFLEQKYDGRSWNSFSMGNGSLPVYSYLALTMPHLEIGLQASASYWNPVAIESRTHLNMIQMQVSLGYRI